MDKTTEQDTGYISLKKQQQQHVGQIWYRRGRDTEVSDF